jgi:hypothetical protein
MLADIGQRVASPTKERGTPAVGCPHSRNAPVSLLVLINSLQIRQQSSSPYGKFLRPLDLARRLHHDERVIMEITVIANAVNPFQKNAYEKITR